MLHIVDPSTDAVVGAVEERRAPRTVQPLEPTCGPLSCMMTPHCCKRLIVTTSSP